MTRLGLKSNRERRNREAGERKGSEKATKIGEKGLIVGGNTNFFRFTPCISTRSLHLSSVV